MYKINLPISIILIALAFVSVVISLVSNDNLNPGCKCPRTILQVCGTDAKTYKTLCHLECKLKMEGYNVRFMHKGPCRKDPKEESPKPCRCDSAPWSPVCANKTTYGSLCHFKCEQANFPDDKLTITKKGPCRDPYLIKWIRSEEDQH